ncbi:MAG: signal peptidase II [Oscillospiraceae bacterium]|jgi:signal peptidase II|nr:signal peptidase II [Oscillospiraceae bacterium]
MYYIFIAVVIMLVDQWSKLAMVRMLPVGGETDLIPGVMSLTVVHNYGAAFSMLQNMRPLLLGLTAAVCAVLFVYLLAGRRRSGALSLSLAMILGGALGNAADRLINGYVVDMFRTLFIDFPVFNVADCFVTVGGIILCACLIFDKSLASEKSGSGGRKTEKHDADNNGN